MVYVCWKCRKEQDGYGDLYLHYEEEHNLAKHPVTNRLVDMDELKKTYFETLEDGWLSRDYTCWDSAETIRTMNNRTWNNGLIRVCLDTTYAGMYPQAFDILNIIDFDVYDDDGNIIHSGHNYNRHWDEI